MKPIPSLLAAAAALVLLAGAGAPAFAKDRDNNPPGRAGGPGTNWENPPAPRGGPGTSPDRYYRHNGIRYAFAPHNHGYYYNAHFGYWHPTFGFWNQKSRCWLDNENNPPRPFGGRGTYWENPPGIRGGPGASPDRYGKCR
ncbi:MAG: hypothetical protein ACK5W3_12325 [Hyphomonadaceae bacterium]